MITRIALLSLLLPLAATAHAENFGDFSTRVRADLLKPFALDIGGVIGGAEFHDGRPVGFPGLSLNIVGAVQSHPDRDDRILRDSNVKAFGWPFFQAAVGLPFSIDVLGHGFSVGGVTVIGGGLRYALFKSGPATLFLPNVGTSFFYDNIDHGAFKGNHLGFNAVAGWGLPIISPFAMAGIDSTRIEAKPGTPVPGVAASATGSRFMLGGDFHAIPFTHLRGGYTIFHGIGGGSFDLSVQF